MAHTETALLPLAHLTRVMRSKNAGPLCLTIDLFFHEAAGFERASRSPALSVSAITPVREALAVRLPANAKPYIYEISLTGNAPIREFTMATSITELSTQ